MSFWLGIVSDYQSMHVILCERATIIETKYVDKTDSNKQLLTLIDELLTKHSLTLSDLLYIGVNVGPAPYTSLRIAIATANGLAYATQLKLIGIDGLTTLLEQYCAPETSKTTVALLNAFNQDLFYGIQKKESAPSTGYEHIDLLLERILQSIDGPICFVGNGVTLYHDTIKKLFPHAQIPNPIPEYASLEWLIKKGWQSWQNKENITDQLFPLYLKNLNYKNSISVK